MSSDYAATYVDQVDETFVRETCPTEYQAFVDALRRYGLEMEQAARYFMWEQRDTGYLTDDLAVPKDRDRTEYTEACVREVQSAWDALRQAFAAATAVGESRLELSLGFHDPEEGGAYDEVEGVYWHVYGAYQLSPAGQKYERNIERKHFVVFG
jgi:hypothetical protein